MRIVMCGPGGRRGGPDLQVALMHIVCVGLVLVCNSCSCGDPGLQMSYSCSGMLVVLVSKWLNVLLYVRVVVPFWQMAFVVPFWQMAFVDMVCVIWQCCK